MPQTVSEVCQILRPCSLLHFFNFRVALTKKLGSASSDVNDIIVDKLAWLEQQIDYMAKREEQMMQTQ